ncbi:hypothetical protein [Streptomyces sp. NPDC101206]|uniref:hypothetical protein n=1 Tax=Streptomyces sp. NPDC101206 TaxID=3366128 RepID=UPI00380A40ED
MEIYLEPTNEVCPSCGEKKVRQRREKAAWGGEKIVKFTDAYCNSGCTRQQVEAAEGGEG